MTPACDQHPKSRLREELYRVAGDNVIETCKDEEPQVESRFDVQIRSQKRKDAKLKHSPANDTHDVSKAVKWKAEAEKSLPVTCNVSFSACRSSSSAITDSFNS